VDWVPRIRSDYWSVKATADKYKCSGREIGLIDVSGPLTGNACFKEDSPIKLSKVKELKGISESDGCT